MHLVTKTPGELSVKQMLNIPLESQIDFIRWNLVMQDDHQFSLDIQFGESQPNTLGFKNGGTKKRFTGRYTVAATDHINVVYHMRATGLTISLAKISENVLHLLTELPTTFNIRKIIDGKAQNVSGKWIIRKGTGASEGQIMYIIEPDKPAESISFLVADKHVLFFLNQQQQPYIGNADFSFTLNRKL